MGQLGHVPAIKMAHVHVDLCWQIEPGKGDRRCHVTVLPILPVHPNPLPSLVPALNLSAPVGFHANIHALADSGLPTGVARACTLRKHYMELFNNMCQWN